MGDSAVREYTWEKFPGKVSFSAMSMNDKGIGSKMVNVYIYNDERVLALITL